MTMIKNVTVNLGPYDLMVDGKFIGTVDNVTIEVAEATEDEVERMRSNPVLLLMRRIELVKVKGET